MKLPSLDEGKPIYQQIIDYFSGRIESGVLPPGFKLPTVRTFAADNNIAQGTVKHAYDLLEQQGYLEKAQGRGTFVRNLEKGASTGKKEQAMAAIEGLLDCMAGLGFTAEETRIYLDLKLREREGDVPLVRLGAVDCCPETLWVMAHQIGELPHVEVHEYLLSTVLDAPRPFDPGMDILVTTPTHFGQVEGHAPEDQRLARLVMAVSRRALLELARIPQDYKVAIVCASRRFAQIITNAYENYELLPNPPAVVLFGQGEPLEQQLCGVDQIILPSSYWRFAAPSEQEMIQSALFTAPPILFDYRIERGSLLFLEEQINALYRAKQAKV